MKPRILFRDLIENNSLSIGLDDFSRKSRGNLSLREGLLISTASSINSNSITTSFLQTFLIHNNNDDDSFCISKQENKSYF